MSLHFPKRFKYVLLKKPSWELHHHSAANSPQSFAFFAPANSARNEAESHHTQLFGLFFYRRAAFFYQCFEVQPVGDIFTARP